MALMGKRCQRTSPVTTVLHLSSLATCQQAYFAILQAPARRDVVGGRDAQDSLHGFRWGGVFQRTAQDLKAGNTWANRASRV